VLWISNVRTVVLHPIRKPLLGSRVLIPTTRVPLPDVGELVIRVRVLVLRGLWLCSHPDHPFPVT
jgi:hypothetical protein